MKTAAFQTSSAQDSRQSVRASAEVAPKDGCTLAGVDRCAGNLNIVKVGRSAAAENRGRSTLILRE
jgi:hypothetical protein